MLSEIKAKLEEVSKYSRELAETVRSRVAAAVEAGKEAAVEKKQELEAMVEQEPQSES